MTPVARTDGKPPPGLAARPPPTPPPAQASRTTAATTSGDRAGEREERAVERMDDANPLFSEQIKAGEYRVEKKPRGRQPVSRSGRDAPGQTTPRSALVRPT